MCGLTSNSRSSETLRRLSNEADTDCRPDGETASLSVHEQGEPSRFPPIDADSKSLQLSNFVFRETVDVPFQPDVASTDKKTFTY